MGDHIIETFLCNHFRDSVKIEFSISFIITVLVFVCMTKKILILGLVTNLWLSMGIIRISTGICTVGSR